MTHQPPLLPDDSYAAALATLKRSGVPLAVVGMHGKFGIRDGETCGTCGSRLELWGNGVHHYCSRSFSYTDVPETTPACRKWQAKG